MLFITTSIAAVHKRHAPYGFNKLLMDRNRFLTVHSTLVMRFVRTSEACLSEGAFVIIIIVIHESHEDVFPTDVVESVNYIVKLLKPQVRYCGTVTTMIGNHSMFGCATNVVFIL